MTNMYFEFTWYGLIFFLQEIVDDNDKLSIDPMAGASSYYKRLYKRRFSDPIEDNENRHAVIVSACNVMENVHHFNNNLQYGAKLLLL